MLSLIGYVNYVSMVDSFQEKYFYFSSLILAISRNRFSTSLVTLQFERTKAHPLSVIFSSESWFSDHSNNLRQCFCFQTWEFILSPEENSQYHHLYASAIAILVFHFNKLLNQLLCNPMPTEVCSYKFTSGFGYALQFILIFRTLPIFYSLPESFLGSIV